MLADADLIHCTVGDSEKDEEEAIRKASTVGWSCLPCEVRFWDWKLRPAKAYYL